MRSFLRLFLVLFLCSVAAADPQAAVDPVVAQFMQHYKSTAVGVGIISHGQVTYVQSYGSLKNNQAFDLASVSKSLTAVVAVKYAEQGKLDLDAPVTQYLPEVHLPKEVTVKGLLSHTSGLPHYTSDFPTSGYTLANFTTNALTHAPGKYVYSSPGYFLLSKVLEKVDRRPFLQQINEELAAPAGASTLTLDPEAGWRLGAGGLMASPESITQIALALLQSKVLSHAGYEVLWTPLSSEGYAMGFFVSEGPPVRISHNGSHPEEGIATRWVLWPETGNAIVILTKSPTEVDPGELSTAILGALK